MEESVFALDSDGLLQMTKELRNCSFAGKTMEEVIDKVERKIEMSDLFSAVEMLARWKKEAEVRES